MGARVSFALTHRKNAHPINVRRQQRCNRELRSVSSWHLMLKFSPAGARGKASL